MTFYRNLIQILDTLVLGIELPADIIAAINRQTEQYYMIQEYKFRVEREAEESKRKQIEAEWDSRLPAHGQPRNLRVVSALARY